MQPKPKVNKETVARLEEMLAAARAGTLFGFVGGFLYNTRHETMIVGAAWDHATLCRGMCDNLNNQLWVILSIHPPGRGST